MIPGDIDFERGEWRSPHSTLSIASMAELACVVEASAAKPGNVSPGRPFADMTYHDFLASAAAIRDPFNGVSTRPIGATILLATEATSRCTRANTNLGIILLLAPIARAASDLLHTDDPTRLFDLQNLRHQLEVVLQDTTVDDAREVYKAIRLANPGGLGSAAEQDVAREPTVTLLEAMRLAAQRDGIAREYTTSFATTFGIGVPALMRARRDHLAWQDAVIETFLTIVAAGPDTHVARRGGQRLALEVSDLAQDVLAAGGVRTDDGRRAIEAMDQNLRDERNVANPGTSADLTAAAVFVTMIVRGWRSPDPVLSGDPCALARTVGG